MANNNKKKVDEAQGIDTLNESLTGISEKVEKNKKKIGWIVAIVVIVAVAVIGFVFFNNRSNSESAARFSNIEPKAATEAAGNDSLQLANEMKMLKDLAASDKGKDGATLANIDLAGKYYEKKQYKEALEAVKDVKVKDALMMANLQILAGDCYVNLNKLPEALGEYDKAIATAKENPETAVRALLKKATVLDAQKKYAEALEAYETIQSQYTDYAEQLKGGQYSINVEAYIAREKARLGK